jgi:hypothetical protein
MSDSRELAEIDHDEWTVPDAIIERLDNIDNRLDKIEKDTAEFKALAAKIWGFVEQMKDNPMLSAMLGGIPKQR